MAKLSKKSCHPEAPAAAGQPAPRVAPSRETADQRLRRFRFFSCFRVGSKPLDEFLAETARRGSPEMAPQGLEKIESAPENGMGSEASKPQHLVHGRAADRALRPGAARTLSNSTRGAGRKFSALQSIEIARNRIGISEASPARRTDRRSSRAGAPLALTHAAPGLEPSPVELGKLQKKAPKVLKSLDAKLKSAPGAPPFRRRRNGRRAPPPAPPRKNGEGRSPYPAYRPLYISRSAAFCTLPIALRGSSSTKITRLGVL